MNFFKYWLYCLGRLVLLLLKLWLSYLSILSIPDDGYSRYNHAHYIFIQSQVTKLYENPDEKQFALVRENFSNIVIGQEMTSV